MPTHSRILAWRSHREKPGRLQSSVAQSQTNLSVQQQQHILKNTKSVKHLHLSVCVCVYIHIHFVNTE